MKYSTVWLPKNYSNANYCVFGHEVMTQCKLASRGFEVRFRLIWNCGNVSEKDNTKYVICSTGGVINFNPFTSIKTAEQASINSQVHSTSHIRTQSTFTWRAKAKPKNNTKLLSTVSTPASPLPGQLLPDAHLDVTPLQDATGISLRTCIKTRFEQLRRNSSRIEYSRTV